MIPMVAFDQIYSFNRDAPIQAIPKPEQIAADQSAQRPRNCLAGSSS
jgi:hypothetical protein